MNVSLRYLNLCLVLLLAGALPSGAQTTDTLDSDVVPPGSTVITSDELRSDQKSSTSVFTGNVTVIGNNFNLTCQEMTVIFKAGKVDHIVAVGNVVITQPDRITHCGQAEYFKEDDKFVLTDQPNIIDNKKNQLFAPVITIYRTNQKMITSGGRSKTVILDSGMGSTTTPATPKPTE